MGDGWRPLTEGLLRQRHAAVAAAESALRLWLAKGAAAVDDMGRTVQHSRDDHSGTGTPLTLLQL
jgi:hypothetical protein